MFTLGDRKLQNILVHCDHGMMIVNRFDSDPNVSIATMLLDHGNNNTVEANLTAQVLNDVVNPIIFDVGSNIGTYATWIARWAKPKNGKVYCFEPQRQVFQILCGNMAINNIDNVYAFNIGLGKENKFIDLPDIDYLKPNSSFGAFSLDGVNRHRYSNIDQLQRIKIETIDNFVNDWNIEKIDFIKIDAEGLDIDVIEGGKNVINRFKPDLFVEYLNLGSSKDEDTAEEGKLTLVNYLESLGYKTFVVGHDVFATIKEITQLQ